MVETVNIDDFIREKGYPLIEIGVNSFGFKRDSALTFIQVLDKASIPVFGGDVYLLTNAGLEATYDNRHCDPLEGEEQVNYCRRANAAAADYIHSYRLNSDKNLLFDLVFDLATKASLMEWAMSCS